MTAAYPPSSVFGAAAGTVGPGLVMPKIVGAGWRCASRIDAPMDGEDGAAKVRFGTHMARSFEVGAESLRRAGRSTGTGGSAAQDGAA